MEVTVSITMSKTIDIEDTENIREAVIDTYCLPNMAYIFIPEYLPYIKECLQDWIVDDFEVIKE